MKFLLVFLLTLFLAGCQVVQPWERGTLAKDEMQWANGALESRFRAQVFDSKEAASGSSGADGGGCGCN